MARRLLGKNIRRYRLECQLTQEALADILSVSHQVISKWENDLATPDIDTLCSMAHFFEISLDELCGISTSKIDTVVEEIKSFVVQNNSYDAYYAKLKDIEVCLSSSPTNEDLLFSTLQFLRAMHDTVESDEQKDFTNDRIVRTAERILDFSKNDSYRSFAHYNLALYYSEQQSSLNDDQTNRSLAEQSAFHADLVLYKDMHKTFYHSFGTVTDEEQRLAREKTFSELLNSTKQAAKNLLRLYQNQDASDRDCAPLCAFLKELEAFTS